MNPEEEDPQSDPPTPSSIRSYRAHVENVENVRKQAKKKEKLQKLTPNQKNRGVQKLRMLQNARRAYERSDRKVKLLPREVIFPPGFEPVVTPKRGDTVQFNPGVVGRSGSVKIVSVHKRKISTRGPLGVDIDSVRFVLVFNPNTRKEEVVPLEGLMVRVSR